MKFIDKFCRNHPRFGISNMMMHIAIINAIVFVVQYILRINIEQFLYLDRAAVLNLELWRLITFIFIPPSSNILFAALALYFYYSLGRSLENSWGTAHLTVFYLITMLGTIVAAMITGGRYSGSYVNLSIFLAFACIYPNMQIMLMGLIPLKVKYLAYAYVALMVVEILAAPWTDKLAVLVSLTGVLVFFGSDLIRSIRAWLRRMKYKR